MDLDSESLKSIRYMLGMNLLTKLLILVKGILLENEFSNFIIFGDYQLAFTHIMLLSSILADGFVLSIINVYRKIEEEKGREYVFKHLNNLLSIVGVIGFLITGLIMVLKALDIFNFINPEYSKFLVLGIPMITMAVLRVIFTGFLQMRHGFFAGPRGNVVRGLLYVIYLSLIGDKLGLEGLMLFGNIILIIQIMIAYYGTIVHDYEFEFGIDFKDEYLKDSFKGILYIVFIFYIYELSVDKKHDNRFIGLFIGSLISSVVAVVYPLLCERYQKGIKREQLDYDEFNEIFLATFAFIIKWTMPILVIGLVASDLINQIFHMKIDINFFISHGIGLISISLLPFLFRTMIAYGDFKNPMILSILAFLVSYILKGFSSEIISFLAYDIGLLLALILALININRRTNFMDKEEFGFYMENTMKSSGFILLILLIIDFVFIKYMNIDLDASIILYSSSIILLIIYHCIYKRNSIIKNES